MAYTCLHFTLQTYSVTIPRGRDLPSSAQHTGMAVSLLVAAAPTLLVSVWSTTKLRPYLTADTAEPGPLLPPCRAFLEDLPWDLPPPTRRSLLQLMKQLEALHKTWPCCCSTCWSVEHPHAPWKVCAAPSPACSSSCVLQRAEVTDRYLQAWCCPSTPSPCINHHIPAICCPRAWGVSKSKSRCGFQGDSCPVLLENQGTWVKHFNYSKVSTPCHQNLSD